MRPIDPNSARQKLIRAAKKLGMPLGTAQWRLAMGVPLDAPYEPRARGAARRKIAAALSDASARDAKRYHGTPCKRHGTTERYTASRSCVLCATEATQRRRAKRD